MKKKIIVVFSVFLVSIITISVFSTTMFTTAEQSDEKETAIEIQDTADSDPLAPYYGIVDRFNSQYGTDFQIMTDETLEVENSNRNELVAFLTSMTEEEFWNYLYDAYISTENNQFEEFEGQYSGKEDVSNEKN